MAVIDKLVIAGLRSFGPYDDDQQNIKISTPLTLILGENGCGKTTIIEALKFACSGDVPGGSKSGQGFVNDPKLSSIQSVKGQVRLKFSDAKGIKYLVIKSVQVTNKGATSQFKRLDSTLKRIKNDGTSEDISSRCSDIDSVVCEILGVSRAILNNVVFCHQENAAWPLDEAKKLKEKFDEIFGATEYNKCAEILRKSTKEWNDKIRDLQSYVGMAKQTKELVDRKRSDMQEKEEKLNAMQDTIKEKQDSLVPIMTRLQEISELEDNLSKLKENYTKMETRKKGIIEQENSILANITEEFSGTDEELQQEISSFQVNRGKLTENIVKLKDSEQSVDNQKKLLEKQIDKMQIKLGKLQGEKTQQNAIITERNGLIQKTSENIGIETSPSFDTNEDVLQGIAEINKNIETSKKDYHKFTQDCDAQETELQQKINASRDKLAKVTHAIDTKTQQTQEFKKKTRDINSKLRELDYSDEQLKSLQNKIARIDNDLKNWKESFDVDSVTKSIDSDKQKMQQHEEKLETLERENKVLQQNSIIEAELETLRHGIIKRESDIDMLKNKHYDNFNKIFKEEEIPSPGFIKKAVEVYKQTNSNKINDLTRKVAMKQKESTTLETKYKFQKENLESLRKELHKSEQAVSQLCKGKPFEKVCNDLHQEIEKLQKDKGQYSSARIMYEKFVQEFEKEKPCCPICQTGFTDKQSLAKEIVTSLKDKIQGIPEQLQNVEVSLNDKQQQYKKVLQLKPISTKIEELTNMKIPQTESDVSDMDSFYKRVSKELDELNEQLSLPQVIVEACSKVIGDAALIDQHQLEVTRSQRKIVDLEEQLVQVASKKSKQQTEAEIEDLRVDLNNARRNCEASRKKLQQHNERCQELREERSKHVEKQLDLQKAMQGKPQLQEQLVELSQKEEALEVEIRELKLQINPLKSELNEAENNKENIKKNNRKKLSDAQTELNRTQKALDDILKLQKNVELYIQRDGDGAFQAVVKELCGFKETLESLEVQKKEITNNINDLNKQLASQESCFRTLTDNQTLRTKRKEAEVLTIEVEKLKKQIGDSNYRTVHAEKQQLYKESDTMRHEISTCEGVIQQLKEELRKIKADLNNPENKQAHSKYKNLLIKHTASKHVKDNLEVYVKALEFGILKFHQERMAQINKIIKQLWRSIYRGNDCDYIEIKTDEIKTTNVKRTYNYKVVQMRNDVEIDMRGRCSAGQKVLACLVIRMALAETFSQNCGILALDEPTTNLDRANIESLSLALARIVTARQAERNFQLLVITHDEEFLDALTKVDKVSHYWKVSRNERGNTRIQRVYL